jgi:acylphosphatase
VQAVETVRYRVRVRGRVQGVWYRESCRRQAIQAGVAGWVSNNHDGTVEAVLEGDAAAVEGLLTWMRSGPPHAVVSGLDVQTETPRGEQGFVVR